MAHKAQPNRPMPRDAEGRFQPRRSTWNTASQNSRSSSAMTTGLLSLIGGSAIGAAIMYLMDPESGQYRRTKALDTAHRALETTTDTLSSAYEGAGHMLGDAWETVGHKASDLSESAAAAVPSMPSRRQIRRSGTAVRRGPTGWRRAHTRRVTRARTSRIRQARRPRTGRSSFG